MKASDGRDLPVLDERSHFRQKPDLQANWQDSVVLVWWDLASGVGGLHRIGHEHDGQGGGSVALWNTLFSPQGIFKKTVLQPLRDADFLPRGFGGGEDSCRSEYIDGEHVWTIDDDDVSARISHRDISANVDCYPKGGRMSDDFAAAHLDIPGTVTGWVKIKGQEYPIAGLGIRDHGWGPRDWGSMLSHRWVAGSFGPELSFVAVSWHTIDESLATFGWVVRNGEITFAEKLDILAYVEIDALINRGGHLQYRLTTGEVLDIDCTPLSKGVVSFLHDVCCVDVMCGASCNGLTGFCDFESTANIQKGSRRPGKLINAHIDSGFFPA